MASAWIEHDPPSRRRVVTGWLVAVGTVALLVVGAWVLAWAWRDRLPDPLAIHWGSDGAANGTATLDGTIRVTTGLGLSGVMALVVVGAALLGRPRWLRGWMTGLAPVAALAPASLVLTLLPNLGVPQWQQAAISGWEILIVLVVPGLAAGVAWFAAARPARASTVGPTIAPDAPIATTHAAYEERQVMRVGIWIAAATIAVILALALPLGWVALVVGLPIVAVPGSRSIGTASTTPGWFCASARSARCHAGCPSLRSRARASSTCNRGSGVGGATGRRVVTGPSSCAPVLGHDLIWPGDGRFLLPEMMLCDWRDGSTPACSGTGLRAPASWLRGLAAPTAAAAAAGGSQ